MRNQDSFRVKTKGRPLKEGTSHFTSLQQLYDMNKTLLSTHYRANSGWGLGPVAEREHDLKRFTRFRPSEEYIDDLFEELKLYWDAIIGVIPDLQLNPSEAKNHQADGSEGAVGDNVLFWPIGQDVVISVARSLLDQGLDSPENPTLEQAKYIVS